MMGSTRLIKLVFDISDIKGNFETEREERLRIYSGWIFRSKMSAAATEKGFEKPWRTNLAFHPSWSREHLALNNHLPHFPFVKIAWNVPNVLMVPEISKGILFNVIREGKSSSSTFVGEVLYSISTICKGLTRRKKNRDGNFLWRQEAEALPRNSLSGSLM